jgi:hypothetical protein
LNHTFKRSYSEFLIQRNHDINILGRNMTSYSMKFAPNARPESVVSIERGTLGVERPDPTTVRRYTMA